MKISTTKCTCEACIHKDCCKFREELKEFLEDLHQKKTSSDYDFIEINYACKYYANPQPSIISWPTDTARTVTPYWTQIGKEDKPNPDITKVGDWPPSPYIVTVGDHPGLSNVTTSRSIEGTVKVWNGDAAAPSSHFSRK